MHTHTHTHTLPSEANLGSQFQAGKVDNLATSLDSAEGLFSEQCSFYLDDIIPQIVWLPNQ